MPSSYSGNLLLELMADGENDGLWGDITNENLETLGRAISGVTTVSLAGTTHTLTVTQGTLSEGHFMILELGGSPTGTNTITINPNTVARLYMVRNLSGQDAVFTQGSGGNVTVPNGKNAIIYCNGAGSTAKVTDITADFMRNAENLANLDDPAAALANLGVTATAAEINVLDGATLDISAVTATADEVNKLDGFTGSKDDLNYAKDLRATGVTTAEFDTLDGVDTAGTGFGYVPQGGIIMWSGAIVDIPAGWALCDGTNGTPNLQDRFVVGAGDNYAVGDTGGADDVTLTEPQMPAHSHDFSGTTSSASLSTSGARINHFIQGAFPAQYTGHRAETTSHSHTFSGTTDTKGSSAAHENRPPYYALAYIMKL